MYTEYLSTIIGNSNQNFQVRYIQTCIYCHAPQQKKKRFQIFRFQEKKKEEALEMIFVKRYVVLL